jgi:3-hydroxyisobutyrate dehydrogenase-like beta-hydroxyacid dehydrogenase
MGYEMAARLAKGGADVLAWNRTRAKAEPLAQYGARVAERLGELAARDVVFCMVSTWKDVKHVMHELLAGKHKPRVVIECSSISLEGSAELRELLAARGIDYLAAPVSGNAKVIKAGKLSFVCSGPRKSFDESLPLLKMIAPAASYVGGEPRARQDLPQRVPRRGHPVVAEITVLAQKAARRATPSSSSCPERDGLMFTRHKNAGLVNLDFKVTFTPELLRKDMDLGLDAGRRLEVPMPLASATRDLIQSMMGRGLKEEDFATLLLQQAQASGIELKPENVEVKDGLS